MNKKELDRLIESVIRKQLQEVSVSDKDYIRMIDLIVKKDPGSSVAKSITNKTKAINRFVAGLKLTRSEYEYISNPNNYRGHFVEFGDKAIQLGATHKEIIDILKNTHTPDQYFHRLSALKRKNMGDRFVSDITKTVLKNGYDIKYLPHNGDAITSDGMYAMKRNGRKWTIGYKTEIDLDYETVKFFFDVVTDEGGGPSYYILSGQSDPIFDKIQNGGVKKFTESLNNVLIQYKGVSKVGNNRFTENK